VFFLITTSTTTGKLPLFVFFISIFLTKKPDFSVSVIMSSFSLNLIIPSISLIIESTSISEFKIYWPAVKAVMSSFFIFISNSFLSKGKREKVFSKLKNTEENLAFISPKSVL